MTTQNVSRLVSPLGVRARVAGARHPEGYMCRVPGSTDPPFPRPRDPFKYPTARRPDPHELLELLFYRGDPRAGELLAYSICIPRSIVGDFPTVTSRFCYIRD